MLIPYSKASDDDLGDDSQLLQLQHNAGAAVGIFIRLGLVFENSKEDRDHLEDQVGGFFSESNINVDSRVKRTYAILLFFTLKVLS